MQKLKILIVTQGIWTPRYGAVKVHIEIKEEYERQGHVVDKISIEDLYPNGQNTLSRIYGKHYTKCIFEFLKKNAHKYDVIDANFACVIYPKESFGFNGLLLFRSHGIYPVYRWAEQNIERYKQALAVRPKKIKIKTRIGNFYRRFETIKAEKDFELSVKYADLVHCLNEAEFQYFKNNGIPVEKLIVLPNGISDKFITHMNSCSTKNRVNSICFIGAWNLRKGVADMDEIISNVQKSVGIEEVILLGGQIQKSEIERSFQDINKLKLFIKPDFDKSELSNYLEKCRVGMFPSYVEGFGLAVVEQLSIGIPVVAYKVPGPSEILNMLDESLLIAPGDILAFSNKVIELFQLNSEAYSELAEKCKVVSKNFLLSHITRKFLNCYNDWLSKNLN